MSNSTYQPIENKPDLALEALEQAYAYYMAEDDPSPGKTPDPNDETYFEYVRAA